MIYYKMSCSPFDLFFPNAETTFPFKNNVNWVMKLSSKLESILEYLDANKSDFSFSVNVTGSDSFGAGPNTSQADLFELLTLAIKNLLKNFIDNYVAGAPNSKELISLITLNPGYLFFEIVLDITSGDTPGTITIPFPALPTPKNICGFMGAGKKPIDPADFDGTEIYSSINVGVLTVLTQALLSLDIPTLVITMLTLTQEAVGKPK
jgi:hypothetical protein